MTERELALFDRRAVRAAMAALAHDGFDIDRAGLTRVCEILERAAGPGLYNLTTLSAHNARKRGRNKTVAREDVEAALTFIKEHGLSTGKLKGGSR